jgi:transposase
MVEKLEKRIKELENQLATDSTNSSKPPSTDNKLKKKKKSLDKNSDKKRGAQTGHKGHHLKFSSNPDSTEDLVPNYCECCNHDLKEVESLKIERRQLFDLPEIQMSVKEFCSHTKVCPECSSINKALFPQELKARVQYGNNIKSFISYCNTYQMLPYERISELIEDLTSHKISVGSVYNFLNETHSSLEEFQTQLKEQLLQEEVLHSDETGININGKLHWIHVVSSSLLTFYMLHQKRGKVAMDAMEILPEYQGILVHDHWKPYNHYNCTHSYCNAHLLRELTGVSEKENMQWSKEMHTLLTKMNNTVHKSKNSDKEYLEPQIVAQFIQDYEKICISAQNCYPPPDKTTKRARGRPKQAKGKNLLDRLLKYQDETLRFLSDFRVPFTNNLAERDLRMVKVKEKISGTFVSFKGGEMFCRIRSYISTLKKNNIPV